jgi:hypothetical protein
MIESVSVAARITCPTCGYFFGLRLGEGGVRFARVGWYLPAGGRLRVVCDRRRPAVAMPVGKYYQPCGTQFWVEATTDVADTGHLRSA